MRVAVIVNQTDRQIDRQTDRRISDCSRQNKDLAIRSVKCTGKLNFETHNHRSNTGSNLWHNILMDHLSNLDEYNVKVPYR